LSPAARKFLVPFIVVDGIFFIALAFWLIHRQRAGPPRAAGPPDSHITPRHLEAKLTEIDLVNKGDAPGTFGGAVDVTWTDAEFDSSEGLNHYTEVVTGRRSVQFQPPSPGPNPPLAPGETRAVGWVKLTDDVPVQTQTTHEFATTQP
jgi:hypothetical protein